MRDRMPTLEDDYEGLRQAEERLVQHEEYVKNKGFQDPDRRLAGRKLSVLAFKATIATREGAAPICPEAQRLGEFIEKMGHEHLPLRREYDDFFGVWFYHAPAYIVVPLDLEDATGKHRVYGFRDLRPSWYTSEPLTP